MVTTLYRASIHLRDAPASNKGSEKIIDRNIVVYEKELI
jgi:hypothetical protein